MSELQFHRDTNWHFWAGLGRSIIMPLFHCLAHRNLWRCISWSSSHTEFYILLISPSAAWIPFLCPSSTALMGLSTSGPFGRMLIFFYFWLLFHTSLTGVVTECGFGATKWRVPSKTQTPKKTGGRSLWIKLLDICDPPRRIQFFMVLDTF